MQASLPLKLTLALIALPAASIACNTRSEPVQRDEPQRPLPAAKADPENPQDVPQGPRLRGEEISYEVDGQGMRGYLVYDEMASGQRPGVIVVHEWWGHTEFVRQQARKLAELGYTAFALDMYGDGKEAKHPDEAHKLALAVMGTEGLTEKRFEAALEILARHPTTDPKKIAAVGYCFGGSLVLTMARRGHDLAAVASFHGSLATDEPAAKGAIKARVIVFHGNDDQWVPANDVKAFKDEMASAGVPLEFHGYDGAKHAFTNPAATELGEKFGLPFGYDESAANDAWLKLTVFLRSVFDE